MQTEIIKLNSLKSSISVLFQNLASKFRSNRDYDITVIVKQSEEDKVPQPWSRDSVENKRNTVAFDSKAKNLTKDIFSDHLSQSYISLQQKIDSSPSFRSNPLIKQSISNQLWSKFGLKRNQNKQNHLTKPQIKKKCTYVQTQDQNSKKLMQTQLKIYDFENDTAKNQFSRVNILQIDSEKSKQESDDGQGSQAGFLIENYLNQALEYIENEQMHQLENFLYKFKEKYNFINVRTETKWSLLMAYCKQAKYQYERAATNYNSVIKKIQENPKLLTLQLADVFSHLARCYFEINEWNKSITAYSSALNLYKKSKKSLEYANCITNLGVLYLQIGYFIQAQKCFLMAYNIKKTEDSIRQSNKKINASILPILFLLSDCNMKMKNYIQCQKLLGNINEIIKSNISIDVIYYVRYQIKKGKLSFFKGNLSEAHENYQEAFSLLVKNKIQTQQYIQVLELIGTLKQQEGFWGKSKAHFQEALKHLQKIVPVDSYKLVVLKKKIDNCNQMLSKKGFLRKKSKTMSAIQAPHKMVSKSLGRIKFLKSNPIINEITEGQNREQEQQDQLSQQYQQQQSEQQERL